MLDEQNKKGVKILIIEDEKSLVDLLKAKLENEGFDIDCAYDGEDGLKRVEKNMPDIILLDIVMPKIDGYGVLEELNKKGLNIPIIIISNSGQPVEIEKTKKLGAVDHLIKTEFKPSDVLEKINKFLNRNGEAEKESFVIEAKRDENARDLGIKIFLVEDDSFLRSICSKKLLKEGYTVYEAKNGGEAIAGLNQVEPDIILLDIILPGIDGFQILSQIKSHNNENIKKTPVIMLSNLGQDDDIKKAMEAGASDYLVKAHFTTEEIVGKIKSVLGK